MNISMTDLYDECMIENAQDSVSRETTGTESWMHSKAMAAQSEWIMKLKHQYRDDPEGFAGVMADLFPTMQSEMSDIDATDDDGDIHPVDKALADWTAEQSIDVSLNDILSMLAQADMHQRYSGESPRSAGECQKADDAVRLKGNAKEIRIPHTPVSIKGFWRDDSMAAAHAANGKSAQKRADRRAFDRRYHGIEWLTDLERRIKGERKVLAFNAPQKAYRDKAEQKAFNQYFNHVMHQNGA